MNAQYIILHHSYSPDNQVTSDWDAIRRYHKSWRSNGRIITEAEGIKLIEAGQTVERPWKDIGYHGGLEIVGGQRCWRQGRSWWSEGAHAEGFNAVSLGFCFVGDYDHNPVPGPVWEAAKRICLAASCLTGIPIKRIIGHRETYKMLGKPIAKQCPGKHWDMDKFREELEELGRRTEIMTGIRFREEVSGNA